MPPHSATRQDALEWIRRDHSIATWSEPDPAEQESNRTAVHSVRERTDGLGDGRRAPEGRTLFSRSMRILSWYCSAAFLVVKALRCRVPLLSRQSARYFPHLILMGPLFFRAAGTPETGCKPVSSCRCARRPAFGRCVVDTRRTACFFSAGKSGLVQTPHMYEWKKRTPKTRG
jgi:hypothetical protein